VHGRISGGNELKKKKEGIIQLLIHINRVLRKMIRAQS